MADTKGGNDVCSGNNIIRREYFFIGDRSLAEAGAIGEHLTIAIVVLGLAGISVSPVDLEVIQ